MANNTVSFKLKIVDEATGSIKKVTASTNELRGVVQKVTDEVRENPLPRTPHRAQRLRPEDQGLHQLPEPRALPARPRAQQP